MTKEKTFPFGDLDPFGEFDPRKQGHLTSSDMPTPTSRYVTRWDTEEAAKQGDAEAQFRLGFMHETGTECDKNYSMAEYWYREAIKNGNADAMFHFGTMAHDGLGMEINMKLALEMWRKGACRGHVLSQLYLGHMHETGKGMFWRSKDSAFYWYRRAANGNNRNAMICLGDLHAGMFSLFKNNKKIALSWYEKAMNLGSKEAEYRHETLLESIKGNETLHQKATAWAERRKKSLDEKCNFIIDGVKQTYDKARMVVLRALKPIRKPLYNKNAKTDKAAEAVSRFRDDIQAKRA